MKRLWKAISALGLVVCLLMLGFIAGNLSGLPAEAASDDLPPIFKVGNRVSDAADRVWEVLDSKGEWIKVKKVQGKYMPDGEVWLHAEGASPWREFSN